VPGHGKVCGRDKKEFKQRLEYLRLKDLANAGAAIGAAVGQTTGGGSAGSPGSGGSGGGGGGGHSDPPPPPNWITHGYPPAQLPGEQHSPLAQQVLATGDAVPNYPGRYQTDPPDRSADRHRHLQHRFGAGG
jgi:hypothetical protein